MAERAERIVEGRSHGWDVDAYENLFPSRPEVRELWQRTLEVSRRPEEWVRLHQDEKDHLLTIIRELRQLPPQ